MSRHVLDRFFTDRQGSPPGGPSAPVLPRSADEIDVFRRKVAGFRAQLGLVQLTDEGRQALLRPPPQKLREVALFYAGFFRRHPDIARKLGVPEGLLERLLQREIDSAQLIQIASELLAAVSGLGLRIAGALQDGNGRVEAAVVHLVADDSLSAGERARLRAQFKGAERDRALLSETKDRATRKVAQKKQALLHRAARARGAQLLDRVLHSAGEDAGPAGPSALSAPTKKGLPR